jgi:hypothetical protein
MMRRTDPAENAGGGQALAAPGIRGERRDGAIVSALRLEAFLLILPPDRGSVFLALTVDAVASARSGQRSLPENVLIHPSNPSRDEPSASELDAAYWR